MKRIAIFGLGILIVVPWLIGVCQMYNSLAYKNASVECMAAGCCISMESRRSDTCMIRTKTGETLKDVLFLSSCGDEIVGLAVPLFVKTCVPGNPEGWFIVDENGDVRWFADRAELSRNFKAIGLFDRLKSPVEFCSHAANRSAIEGQAPSNTER